MIYSKWGNILKRNNIILILIVLVVGVAVAFTLYEQQQVKLHLTKANDYHSQMMAYNPQLESSTVKEDVPIIEKNIKPLETNELNELRAANTLFASSNQKEYINAAIQINTDNSKIDDLEIAVSKTTNLGELENYATDLNNINKDVSTFTNTRDAILAAHPEEFGFEIVKN